MDERKVAFKFAADRAVTMKRGSRFICDCISLLSGVEKSLTKPIEIFEEGLD